MVTAYWPRSLKEALEIRAETAALPYAGGTDLMVRHRHGAAVPADPGRPIMFLNRIAELKTIVPDGPRLLIAAGASYTEILHHPDVPDILKQACRLIGAPAVQNAGTIGGNLGNASPAADTIPPLAVLDATVRIASTNGNREVKILDFCTGPGTTVLNADELIQAISIPDLKNPDWITGYRKVGTRRANALSKASFAGLARRNGEQITEIRISLGAVAPVVVRCPDLEKRLTGKDCAGVSAQLPGILHAYGQRMHPITDQRSDADYRRTVCQNMIRHYVTREVLCN